MKTRELSCIQISFAITTPPLNKLRLIRAETLPFSSFLTVKNSRSKLQNHKMNF